MATTTPNPEASTAGRKEVAAMAIFTATVSAADEADALAKVARRLPEGFTVTGRTTVRSARHLLMDVQVAGDGDRDDCWVILTSYGISPSADLGSVWQTVAGVGC